MVKELDKLKKETYKLLSNKARGIWDLLEWDNEEVGNSKIGFLSIDSSSRPEKIAKFLNFRANKVERTIDLIDLNKSRDELVKKYGDKIIPGVAKDEELTTEEKVAKIVHGSITKVIQEKAPEDIKRIDKLEFFLRRNKYKFSKYKEQIKKGMIKYFFILVIVIVILFLYQFVAGYFIRNKCLMNAYKDSEQYVPTLKEFSDGRERGFIFEYLYKDCLEEYWLLDL